MSVERSKCPTCGGAVVIHTGREGTSHMVPANSADQTEAFIERNQLRGAVEALSEIHSRTFMTGRDGHEDRIVWIRARAARILNHLEGR